MQDGERTKDLETLCWVLNAETKSDKLEKTPAV